MKDVPPVQKREKLAWEKELLGLYVSGHPFEDLRVLLEEVIVSCADIPAQKKDAFVYCAGLVSSVKEIVTKKKGEPMAFLTLEDQTGKIEAIAFPGIYPQIKSLCEVDQLLVCSAKVSMRDGEEAKLLINRAMALSEENVHVVKAMLRSNCWEIEAQDVSVEIPRESIKQEEQTADIVLTGQPSHELVTSLQGVFRSAPGDKRVCFIVEHNGHKRRVLTDYRIHLKEEVMEALASLVGRQNVKGG